MKCHDHPNAPAIDNCTRCKMPMCGMCANFTGDGVFCESCLEVKENEQAVTVETQRLEQPEPEIVAPAYDEDLLEKAKRRDNNGVVLQLCVIGICAAIMVGRLIFFPGPGAAQTQQPELSAEAQAQIQLLSTLAQCLALLQEVGQSLARGERPTPGTTCPNTLQELQIQDTADDVIVSHPRPEVFGYAGIVVSRLDPNPRLIPLENQ